MYGRKDKKKIKGKQQSAGVIFKTKAINCLLTTTLSISSGDSN